MNAQRDVSARAGVFCTEAGKRVLEAILAQRYDRIESCDLSAMTALLGGKSPSKEQLVSLVRTLNVGEGGLDFEVRLMDKIRDAYGASLRRCDRHLRAPKSRRSASVVSEYTDAGSVFSQSI